MASTISLLSKKHFLCSLCEGLFTSPVTTPCGHSFCKVCLRGYWSQSGSDRCPLCKRAFSKRPHLSVNRILAEVTENYRKTRLAGTAKQERPLSEQGHKRVQKTESEVEQMIQERLQKVDKLKYSLKLLKSSCLREVQESESVFSALMSCMEKSRVSVVAAVEERQREAERRVDRLVKELEKEIQDLKGGTTELDIQQTDNEEQIKLSSQHIVSTETRDWSRVTMETDPCVGVARRAVFDLMNRALAEANKLSKSELKRLQKYTAEVTLNARTAHAYLSISEDRKQVRHGVKRQDVIESPRRFDRVPNILANELFSSGRHYWEVEVGDKTEWDLGVAKQSINRKGKFTVSPANGFWTLSLRNGGQYTANTAPTTPLTLHPKPKRVAVFLDVEEGQVSFFIVGTGAHIYTFTDTFKEKLHPFFSPGHPHGTKNSGPLIITSSCCSI